MKNIKNIVLIMLIFAILVGGFGCMNSNSVSSDEIKMDMLQYAQQKYDTTFDIVDFDMAIRGLDSNFHDILVLKDSDGVTFHVYSSTDDDDKFDDYGISCADKALNDYLKDKTDIEFCAMIDLISDSQIMPNEIKGLSVSDFSDKYKVRKITVIVRTDESEFEEKISEIYSLYSYISDMESEYIEYAAVAVQGKDEALKSMFNDVRLNYENDWNSYSSVKKFITTKEKKLTQQQFEALLKEV